MSDSSESYQSGNMRKYEHHFQKRSGMLFDDIRLDRELDQIREVCDELGTKLIHYIEELCRECNGFHQQARGLERREAELEATVKALAKRLGESDKDNAGLLAPANTHPFAIVFAAAFLGSLGAAFFLRS